MSTNHSSRLWRIVVFIVALSLTLGCQLVTGLLTQDSPQATGTAAPADTVTEVAQPPATETPTAEAPATAATTAPSPTTAKATATASPDGAEANAEPTWAPPALLPAPFEEQAVTAEQQRTLSELQAASPPVRDDVALSMAYDGVTDEQLAAVATLPAPQVGDVTPFNVLNIDSNLNVPIEARLYTASEHAYFWFDTTLPEPDEGVLQETAEAFDQIYEHNVANFGRENSPGIDGDERLHILNASPGALCDEAARCGLLGYFSSSDALPRIVNEYSNEREMFVMNGESFGTSSYVHVLAHEFRHMIEDNYDQSDADWEVEGSAIFAEELAGFSLNALDRGNTFLQNPDQQLNRWTDGDTYPYYGQGYVLNRYIYDRLGPDLYRDFATHPADGLDAVTAVAEENGLDFDGQSLWLDWLAALAIHSHPQAPEVYRLGDGRLRTAAMSRVSEPETWETSVHQYAADYYLLEGDDALTVQFEGNRHTPLLDTPAASGQQYWYAQRVNYSHMQLERNVDLSNVSEATLNYDVYHDIEVGYDFAYVSVSEDGGLTWDGLVADGMQGLEESHDPGDAAYTERFYTGESNGWKSEQIDLTPYAGNEIRLRFSYVTDPILTFGGLALDNISIPQIGFFDDAEGDVDGWQTQGFTRATATLPQPWRLQLITFTGGAPQVTRLELEEGTRLAHTVDLAESEGRAILIVAAAAPMTLEVGEYRLEIGR